MVSWINCIFRNSPTHIWNEVLFFRRYFIFHFSLWMDVDGDDGDDGVLPSTIFLICMEISSFIYQCHLQITILWWNVTMTWIEWKDGTKWMENKSNNVMRKGWMDIYGLTTTDSWCWWFVIYRIIISYIMDRFIGCWFLFYDIVIELFMRILETKSRIPCEIFLGFSEKVPFCSLRSIRNYPIFEFVYTFVWETNVDCLRIRLCPSFWIQNSILKTQASKNVSDVGLDWT